ncbi:MAG: cysteine--tRNA ligase [Proteobacteria bacterium]|nr:cysteine--tRNA ligase [Pseudomonadota bacterium]
MSLKLYNTATRRKDTFAPIDAKNVRMYVCGPTVYDYAHIGNARPYIVFDVLYRLLRHEYGEDHVKYVRNITDVDDKINAAAAEQGVPISEITEKTTKVFHEDMKALNVLPPGVEPRATAHIPQMVAMIETLIAKEHAYVADEHVLFDVPSMKDYGALSGRNRDEQIAGARVEVAPYKKDPADFVLWKPSASDQPGWKSPWGWGRPGWHLECSAMSKEYLGTTFDIHAGGIDLVFPHHENEIAQSRCAHGGAPLANVWMHNGYLTLEGEKMSKSLGNVVTVRQLLAKWPAEVIRLNMLKTHYRKPLDWTEERLRETKDNLDRWYRVIQGAGMRNAENPPSEFLDVLGDDLNTPAAIRAMEDIEDRTQLKAAGDFLGVLQQRPEAWFKQIVSVGMAQEKDTALGVTPVKTYSVEGIEKLITERNAARKAKDFAASDRIRDELKEGGVILEDKPDGTTDWRRA